VTEQATRRGGGTGIGRPRRGVTPFTTSWPEHILDVARVEAARRGCPVATVLLEIIEAGHRARGSA
jgi:hypothetical protein